ncbi:MAG: FAD-binding oxidoreductase [Opitutales bacterium]
MKLSQYNTDRTYAAEVVSSERITDKSTTEVRHIILRVPDPTFQYLEGQSIAVIVPGPHAFGNEDHVRLYSIASSRQGEGQRGAEFSICVRRCDYIDEVSGERYPGIASNFLCDLSAGDEFQIAGPYGRQFLPPYDETSNILMIGVGTGIAPFRAFVKHIYESGRTWQGKVRLFYGARTGMDLLYMNDQNKDIANYYDETTFKAFEALSPRPHFDEPADIDRTIKENRDEVWELLNDPKTSAYVSGLSKLESKLDTVLSEIASSEDDWLKLKSQLINQGRWSTLFYE